MRNMLILYIITAVSKGAATDDSSTLSEFDAFISYSHQDKEVALI